MTDVSKCRAYKGEPWWPRCVRLARPDHAAQNARSCLPVAQGQPQEMLQETWEVGSKRQPCVRRETGVRSGTIAVTHTRGSAVSPVAPRLQLPQLRPDLGLPTIPARPRLPILGRVPVLLHGVHQLFCGPCIIQVAGLEAWETHGAICSHEFRLTLADCSRSRFPLLSWWMALLTSDQHQVQVQQHCTDAHLPGPHPSHHSSWSWPPHQTLTDTGFFPYFQQGHYLNVFNFSICSLYLMI